MEKFSCFFSQRKYRLDKILSHILSKNIFLTSCLCRLQCLKWLPPVLSAKLLTGPSKCVEVRVFPRITLWLTCECCVLSSFSRVQLFATLWMVAHQAPLSMRFSRQEYQSGLPCLPSGDLPNPGIQPTCLMSAVLAGSFFTIS